jgi:hypothetical protein
MVTDSSNGTCMSFQCLDTARILAVPDLISRNRSNPHLTNNCDQEPVYYSIVNSDCAIPWQFYLESR